jgi:UDP-glucose:(heptosyl)LPS alpha-1,3-glucosyltransferase
MRFAFCLFKYFPYGGMQRSFLHIAEVCLERGHQVEVFTLEWEGGIPAGLEVHRIPASGLMNHQRYLDFTRQLSPLLAKQRFDAVVGFNKMPGLDVYYAADPCFQALALNQRNWFYRIGGRYRQLVAFERAVFQSGHADILLLTEPERENFMRFYATPAERFHLLPPGVAHDRCVPGNAPEIRGTLRKELRIGSREKLLLLIGSGFRMKGVDRAMLALAALPEPLKSQSHLVILGQDNPQKFRGLAKRLGIDRQVRFLGGRSDIPRFLLTADLLLHPAYFENTGTVLLEALATGLPVLATNVCGYAFHVVRAQAGELVGSPFRQQELNERLGRMLSSSQHDSWRRNALHYIAGLDIASRPHKAADVIEDKARRLKLRSVARAIA